MWRSSAEVANEIQAIEAEIELLESQALQDEHQSWAANPWRGGPCVATTDGLTWEAFG